MTAPKKSAEKRIYAVTDKSGETRLVNAASASAAVAHVYSTEVRVATQQELVKLLGQGVKVEEVKS